MTALLEIDALEVHFGAPERPARAVDRASLSMRGGEIVGIAGESGSGKTTLCLAVIRSLSPAARVRGHVRFDGADLLALPPAEMRRLRGRTISMIQQNPMTAFDPLFTIGNQFMEFLRHWDTPSSALKATCIEQLRRVHMTAPERRLGQYAHQMSGGMKQRILTAIATAAAPKLLIADEPTTALDATIQDEILLLFREIRDRHGTAVMIVTHDLAALRKAADRIVVMYAGRIVEEGPTAAVFASPAHPYTQALLASIPRIDDDFVRLVAIPGQIPGLAGLGPGCPFADRCPQVMERCRSERPPAFEVGDGQRAFCWLYAV